MMVLTKSEFRHELDGAIKHWPNAPAREEAHRLVALLCEQRSVDAVVAFGSAVRSNVKSYDIDLLVVYHEERPRVTPRRMEIDLRCYSRSEVAGLLVRGHDLICWAVLLGKVICERERYWERLVSNWVDSIPLPSVADAEKRGGKAWTLYEDLLAAGDLDAALEQYVTYLTHMARIELVRSNTYPASRPELPRQLRTVGEISLAQNLEQALRRRHLRSEGRENRLRQFLLAARKIGRRFGPA